MCDKLIDKSVKKSVLVYKRHDFVRKADFECKIYTLVSTIYRFIDFNTYLQDWHINNQQPSNTGTICELSKQVFACKKSSKDVETNRR